MENNYFLKVSGKVNIPTSMSIGHNFKVTMDCSITSENKIDNNDGTFDVVYKIEPITCEVLKDNGETVKAKDPRKNSTKIRNLLHWKWQQLNKSTDFEEYYNKFTNYVLANMENIIETIK